MMIWFQSFAVTGLILCKIPSLIRLLNVKSVNVTSNPATQRSTGLAWSIQASSKKQFCEMEECFAPYLVQEENHI